MNKKGIPGTLIVDSAVGAVIDKVDKVFVGAEGVAESGGIINLVGTYSVGVLAHNARKPFYVVTESHKFVRMFPLSSDDLPMAGPPLDFTRRTDDLEDALRGPTDRLYRPRIHYCIDYRFRGPHSKCRFRRVNQDVV